MKKFILIPVVVVLIGIGYVALYSQLKVLGTGIPPGCIKTSGFGGCFGKNNIENLSIQGPIPNCLSIRKHNCQGAGLEIENLCPQNYSIYIQDKKITDKYTYLYYKTNEKGNLRIETQYEYPDTDQQINLDAKVNEESFKIKYIRTKALCD
jgi:hypothetical protein